jgi:hypothetical protein
MELGSAIQREGSKAAQCRPPFPKEQETTESDAFRSSIFSVIWVPLVSRFRINYVFYKTKVS